jgi:hypothetical protein
MRHAIAFVLGCLALPAAAEVIPHTGNFNLRWEYSGQPPMTTSGSFPGQAEVLTIAGPNPEAVEYQYPSGLSLLGSSPQSFTFQPMAGVGQFVPVAPLHWENSLTFSVTFRLDLATILTGTAQGQWRSETPGTAFAQAATWTLLSDVRLTPGGSPTALPALTILAGSTLVTIPSPAAGCALTFAAFATRRRR